MDGDKTSLVTAVLTAMIVNRAVGQLSNLEEGDADELATIAVDTTLKTLTTSEEG